MGEHAQKLGACVLITGSTSGIGLALAELLSGLGYVVAINSRSSSACEALAKKLNGIALPFDVTDSAQLDLSFRLLHQQLTKNSIELKGFVHCAGSMNSAPLHAIKADSLNTLYLEHIESAVMLSKWASRLMINVADAAMVFMSSIVAKQGSEGQVAYSTIKSAVSGLVASLAKEVAPYGIRVNGVEPGVIDTPLIHELSEERRLDIVNNTLLQRLGSPEDVASVIQFLLSEQAKFVTGQMIAVDGGLKL
ncbi:SDR family NAD(P)-dependent oxidoreductase [Marinomonas balearica]|uniref:3-oxoacyl-[acyl-carrier protein] reductase n=1 Tax=Marinomonas balearica TaxID=491947 RepID=A0A4V6PTT0_9GAMM|nr:SDR family NAD(P)-dependent oxidoreductase [Marinomonas balearica]TDO96232.1 3-oxoacyl-[acyl-carrier protein] reductase [Marinomonas balearica]